MTATSSAIPVVDAQTIDVDGVPVAVRRKGHGRPLLFLHGAGFTAAGSASTRRSRAAPT